MTEIGTSWLGAVGAGDDRRGLVVAEHDEHEVVVAVVLHEGEQGVQRVLDRPAVRRTYPLRVAPERVGRHSSTGMPWKIEPSPTSSQSISRGMRVHGAWLDTRSTSAKTGRRSGFASSRRCRAARTYWSGIEAYANFGPTIPEVAPVVDLVVVVERRPLRPVPVVRRHVVDGPPSGALERLAEREAVGLRRAAS